MTNFIEITYIRKDGEELTKIIPKFLIDGVTKDGFGCCWIHIFNRKNNIEETFVINDEEYEKIKSILCDKYKKEGEQ